MDREIINEIMLIEHEDKEGSQSSNLNRVENNTILMEEINVSIIKAVEFCSNILSRNGLGTCLHVDRFRAYRDIAVTDIKFIMNSRNKLMKLFCTFPLVFHVFDNEVALRNWIIFHLNQQKWLKELLPDSFHLVPICVITIQFYCNELFKVTPTFELPLHLLFSHKSIAPEAIQAVTKNIQEFIWFLKLFPQIFYFNGDKVMLSKAALSYRSLETWIKHLLVADFTLTKSINDGETMIDSTLSGMMSYEFLKTEVVLYEAVGFHYKFILFNGPIKGVRLEKLLSKKNKAMAMLTLTKNIENLETFLTSFPELFIVKNKTVFLTRLYPGTTQIEYTSVKEDELNCSNGHGLDMKSNEQAVIFYRCLINNLSDLPSKITEFPINQLVYYNTIAPSEVKKIAKNTQELKKFLSQYPQVFKINNADIIVFDATNASLVTDEKFPTSTLASHSTEKRIFEETFKEAVRFYTNLIYTLGGNAKIEELLDCRWQASKEVQLIATNFEELETFFSSRQNEFTFVNGRVCLTNKTKDSFEVNTLTTFSKSNATENAISFYSEVLRKHENQTLTLLRLTGHRGSAPAEVQSVAKNPKELKTFFSQFPEVFTVIDDSNVTLSKPSEKVLTIQQQNSLFPPEHCSNTSVKDAVEFFSKMLNHYGICGVLNINKLFELKLKSSSAIHRISGSNINQFITFLAKYPQEFKVTNDNVIARKKIAKYEMKCGKYENKDFSDRLLLLIFDFFKMYTSNKTIFHIDYLYNNVGRFFLYNDETPIFPSKSDLLLFLKLYPHIFFVEHYRIVNIMASSKAAFISKAKRRFEYQDNSRRKKPETAKRSFLKPKSPRNVSITSLDLTKPNFLQPKSHRYRSITSLDIVKKPTSDGIEENVLNKSETNEKGAPESDFLIKSKKESETSKRIVQKPNSSKNLSVSSLDFGTKQSTDGIEENLLNRIETNEKGTTNKSDIIIKPRRGLAYKAHIRRKVQISTNVSPLVEPSVSEESLVSELSKNYNEEKPAGFNSSNSSELEDQFWNNQYRPCWRNEDEEEFDIPKIEEIENKIFSHFIGVENINNHIKCNEDLSSSHNSRTVNHSFPKDFCWREDCDGLITEALVFLNDKLWAYGNLTIITVQELFYSFSMSGLEISKYCCSSIQEFEMFLYEFPDHFIISQENVMPRKNEIRKGSYFSNDEEQSLPIALFHFFNLYTKQYDFILLKLLYSKVAKYFCNCNFNQSPIFKSPKDLVLFLEMFPEVFCVDNNQIRNLTVPKENIFHTVKFNSDVIKIDSFLDKKLYSTITSEKCPTIVESAEGWEDYVLERTQIIEDLSQCRVVTAEILNSEKVIALDCEGVSLGAAGRLTLLQIGLINGKVYIFDIIKEPSMVIVGGLKEILESDSIIKVIHDSRNDVANLYTEFGVKITHIFDTRVAHHLIISQGAIPKRSQLTTIGFNVLCFKYGANLNVQKDEMKNIYKCNPSCWMKRPLTKEMLVYAASDVASLVPQVFFNMLKKLKGIPEKSLWELSGKHSLSILNNKDLLFD